MISISNTEDPRKGPRRIKLVCVQGWGGWSVTIRVSVLGTGDFRLEDTNSSSATEALDGSLCVVEFERWNRDSGFRGF